MNVNGIAASASNYETKTSSAPKADKRKTDETGYQDKDNQAAVYEKGENTEQKIYKRDTATIERLKQEAELRSKNLRDLVHKMLMKQGQTVNEATDIYALLREGKLEVDPETRAQAQKDIAEDGYWGIEQTSDRLVSFAKALTGGDPSKAEEMINAVKKGFEEAAKAWGGELPEICKNTIDTAIKKLEAWRDGK